MTESAADTDALRPARLRVALIGNIVGVAFQLCRALRARDVDAHLFLSSREACSRGENGSPEDFGLDRGTTDWLHVWDAKPGGTVRSPTSRRQERLGYLRYTPQLWRSLRSFDAVQAFTLMPIFVADSGRPYIATPTGSDARETARSRSLLGMLLRRSYRRAARIVTTTLDEPIREALAQAGCLDRFQCVSWGMDQPSLDGVVPIPLSQDEPLRYFSSTRWHFRTAEPDQVHKGNDRFLKAAAMLHAEGIPLRLTLLERGEDLDEARRLVTELGLTSVTQWRPPMGRDTLMASLGEHHIVADHFQYGIWGGTCLEAMACTRPVLIYVEPEAERLAYDEPLPVLNVSTVDEIAAAMRHAHHNRQHLRELGSRGREFVERHHGWDKICAAMVQIYRDIANEPSPS